ncbi:MAG TPA: hypothetical protein VL947_04875 [Cytophagales bacterium]|nr:hypothetical protein [Cytophagales bacterium]
MKIKEHFKKLEILEKVNCVMPLIGNIYMDGLELFHKIDRANLDVNRLLEAYFGVNNYASFSANIKHNLIDGLLHKEIEASLVYYGDLCEYIFIMEYLFYHKEDEYELFSDMALVASYKEIHEIKLDTVGLMESIQSLYTEIKNNIDDEMLTKSKGKIKMAEEFQELMEELQRIASMKLKMLRLKKMIKKHPKISTCCN